MAKDYYEILGIKKGASDDEIKRAYRRLAHEYHPDKAGGNEAKFKEINEAYQMLSDKQKRQQYDQFGTTFEQAQAHGGAHGFEGFRDFSSFADAFDFFRQGNARRADSEYEDIDLGDILGGIFGRGGVRQKGGGRDIKVDVEITLEEAANGSRRTISIRKSVKCSECQGSGAQKGSAIKTCASCRGQGRVQETRGGGFFSFSRVVSCQECHGAGKKAEKRCPYCRGDGTAAETVKLDIEIPAGIEDGQTIRLSGQGEAGKHGKPDGDLYIEVHVLRHKHFVRQGDDILYEAEISFTQAALGDKISIPTMEGEIKLEIPAGIQSGTVIRVSGKGIQRSGRKGNLLVRVKIKTPSNLSRKAKQLLKELEGEI